MIERLAYEIACDIHNLIEAECLPDADERIIKRMRKNIEDDIKRLGRLIDPRARKIKDAMRIGKEYLEKRAVSTSLI